MTGALGRDVLLEAPRRAGPGSGRMREGKVLATIDQFGPDMASNCIKTGFRVKKGEKLTGWQKTPVKLVTKKELM